MFRAFSVAMSVSVFLLCPFSVKNPLKNLFHSGDTFQYIFCERKKTRERKPLNTTIVICSAMFEFGRMCTFVTDLFRKILKS